MGARYSAPVQTGPGAHRASYTMGTGFFPGVKSGRCVTLTPHPLLVPWSWKGRAIPQLPLWAVRPVQILSACTRVHFTLLLRAIKGSWANWIIHMLHRNCLRKHIIEGKIRGAAAGWPEGKGRYWIQAGNWNLKGEALYRKGEASYRIVWRTRCDREYGLVARLSA